MAMNKGCTISACVPMFNEKDRIPATLSEIEEFMRKYPGVVDEVVVIDDGSTDATIERCMRFLQKVPLRVEVLEKNRGKWAAIRHGIKVAKNDCILLLDADGSASIEEVAKTKQLRLFFEGKVAIFGSRFAKGATVDGKPLVRSILSAGYRTYVLALYRYATGKTDVDDMQCPLKLFRKSALRFPLSTDRFCGDIELASSLTVPIVTHPVQFMHRAGGSIKATTVWDMAKETFIVALQCKRRRTNQRRTNQRSSK